MHRDAEFEAQIADLREYLERLLIDPSLGLSKDERVNVQRILTLDLHRPVALDAAIAFLKRRGARQLRRADLLERVADFRERRDREIPLVRRIVDGPQGGGDDGRL